MNQVINFKFKKSLFCAFALICSVFFTHNASADFYKYVDEKGIVHLTNDIKNIPEKMRQGARVIKENRETIKKKLIDGKYVIGEARTRLTLVQVEAKKLWWRWIVDPSTGRTRAPVIMGGYLLISMVTFGLIRRHVHGRARKLLFKFLFMGFIAIAVLMYSAHRGHKAYLEYKESPLDIKNMDLENIDLEKLLGVDVESFLKRE